MYFFDIQDRNIYKNSVELGYLNLLNEHLDVAHAIFNKNDSPRAHWGIVLVSILKGYMKEYPTYFQVRNFYEIDLDFLLRNEKIKYVESLLGAIDILVNINHEVYKYAARVMYENRFYTVAYDYMIKSKSINYNDAELHFMLAKYYIENKRYNDAFISVNECINLMPDYYPASVLKQEIEQNYI